MLIPLAAVIVVAATLGYVRFMGFETISYELRHCQETLSGDADWEQVQAAACDPQDAATTTVELVHEGGVEPPDSTSGSVYTFEDWPVNSPSHSISVTTSEVVRTVIVVEPTNEVVRDELTSDATGTRWSGFIGSRGPTEYWVLVTP